MAYFRDCQPFIPSGDPLAAIGDAFTSGVALNLGSFDVKGIPFYPINEEGGIGAGRYANIPFGAWGGGYSENVGVRDYWSQNFDVGANWIDGRYGYRTGWSVPLVQSLGVEGGGGTDVNVPLRADKLGTVDVDNHYGVGGYYKHNQHTGVDWRRGEVKSMFGVGVPFAGVGVNTGVGVAFVSSFIMIRYLTNYTTIMIKLIECFSAWIRHLAPCRWTLISIYGYCIFIEEIKSLERSQLIALTNCMISQ